MREMYTNAADVSPTSPDRNLESISTNDIPSDPFYDRFPWFRPIGRAFVYLTNLLYGLPLVQNVAIVSEHGEIKGYLKIALQQLQTNDMTNEQIKLMRTYRNTSGITKIIFDDETYFHKSSSSIDLSDPEGQFQQKLIDDLSIQSNELLKQLGGEYQFRVTVLEASQISSDYADIFCQFNFLHQQHEVYSTEPLKNQGKPGPPLGFFHVQNVNIQNLIFYRKFLSLFYSLVLLLHIHLLIIFVQNQLYLK
jgi:kinesin family protein 1